MNFLFIYFGPFCMEVSIFHMGLFDLLYTGDFFIFAMIMEKLAFAK